LTNPTAGHTSATGMGSDAQGLRDGDGLTSPSLTNLYEGLHGNGIMRLGDGAKGDSLRNSVVANTPGFIQIGSSQGEVKVYGGFCTLDGVLYKFANGPGSHETFIVGTTGGGASHSGDLPSVPGSNSDVFVVVYLVGRSTPEAHLMYEMGTPAAATSGTPLLPNRFLSSPSVTGNTDLNHQTTVLGVIRYTMSGGAANVTASLGSPVIHDRRTFLRKSPLYLTPMTKGAIGNVDAANALSNPDSFFASPEGGDLTGSTFGAIWQTHREDVAGAKHGIILTALPKNLNTTPVTGTYVLGPDRLEVITTSGNVTFTFDEANIWVITTDAARTINPTGVFSAGHVVDIFHKAGAHNLHFDSTSGGHSSTPINVNIASGESARFVYDGSNWHQVIAAPSSFPSSSGATGLVQLSNGSGGFTSDTKLAWASGSSTLTVDGKLTVTGLIDPTGLVIDEKANVAGTGHSTAAGKGLLWVKDDAPNRLYFTDDAGTDKKVIHATDSVTELSDVSNVGSGAIITGSERSKLSGIEANADVTDATNVTAAGALMDSEVTNLAFVKGLTGGVSNGNVLVANAAVADNDFLKIDGTSVEGRTAAEMRGDLNVADGATANAGTVTSVATTAPITGGTITGSGTIGISAATTSAAGSMSGADKTKLDGIEASATADQTDAEIRAAVEAASDSNVFTDADHTKLNGIAASATAYADADAIAAVEGEATLALTGDVTIAAGKGLTVDGTTLHVDATNDRVGIGTASPATALHVEGANHIIRVKDTSAGDSALTRTMGGLELSAAGMNTSSKFGVPIKFMSTDSAFTTENPKFLAAIVPVARESYTADTKGGMAIAFAVTAKDAGASTVPQVAMTLDSNGRLGIGTGGPQALLHVNGDVEFDGALNHDGSTVGFYGTAPASKTTVAALGGQGAATAGAGAAGAGLPHGDALQAEFAAAVTQINTNINNLQTRLDALIAALSSYGLV